MKRRVCWEGSQWPQVYILYSMVTIWEMELSFAESYHNPMLGRGLDL